MSNDVQYHGDGRTSFVPSRTIRHQLILSIGVPVLVLIGVGLVLGNQVSRLSQNAKQVERGQQVIAKLHEVHNQIVDQETALRGFLITGVRSFLEPHHRATPEQSMRELESLLRGDPQQQQEAAELRARYEGWLSAAQIAVKEGRAAEARALGAMIDRKSRMDEVRATVEALLQREQSASEVREALLAESGKNTQFILLGLIGAAALALALVSRRNVRAIAVTYHSALADAGRIREQLEQEAWLRNGQIQLSEVTRGEHSIDELALRSLDALLPMVEAEAGALYVSEGEGLRCRALLGVSGKRRGELVSPSESLVGRAAKQIEPLVIEEVPADYFVIGSGTGASDARKVALVPTVADGVVHGVLELGFFRAPDARVRELLNRITEPLGIAVRSAQHRARLRELLAKSQQQAEELHTQQEELRAANEELTEQSSALFEAQTQLEERQQELQHSNLNLERQASALRATQARLLEQAAELSRASQYKSEFVANMSHELRTPLNSSLILAKLLAENKQGNLTPEQIKYAETIYAAGNDLLNLINDILDLSKIEAGHMQVDLASLPIPRITEAVLRMFDPIAKQRGLWLTVQLAPDLPGTVETDVFRVQQILKNLLSNALKFTESGGVSLTVSHREGTVHFAVRDTGIGIPEDQHELVFEAFRQADGASTRKHGGTGLGLAICRDLSRLLGGDVTLVSTPGQGSTFTLSLPVKYRGDAHGAIATPPPPSSSRGSPSSRSRRSTPQRLERVGAIPDDRDQLEDGHRTLLVVEDDLKFAKVVLDQAREFGYQCVVAVTADEALALVKSAAPCAVVLDINLPDHSGLSVLDRLKRDPETRHLPVHVMSVADMAKEALSMGAMGYALKPVTREGLHEAFKKLEEKLSTRMRRLLVVEDDEVARAGICELLGAADVQTIAVGCVAEALAALRESTFDCMVTDLTLPDATGYDLLERMTEDEGYAFPPVIVYTGRSLSGEEEQRLRRFSSAIIVKGARSPERLLDEVTLFLHQVEAELPPERQRMLRTARDREALFEGRRILIVEDDVRNVFALSSVLEPKGASVAVARNGREAVERVEEDAEIDLVLMDIMMPEMDGIAAMRAIRAQERFARLPIIALTAKAMRDDQERCLEAGANDYIAKPIDVQMLLSLLRVWMPK